MFSCVCYARYSLTVSTPFTLSKDIDLIEYRILRVPVFTNLNKFRGSSVRGYNESIIKFIKKNIREKSSINSKKMPNQNSNIYLLFIDKNSFRMIKPEQ